MLQQLNALKANLSAMLVGHVDSHMTTGRDAQDWPVDAVYYVEYRLKAWPTFSNEKVTQFFPDAFALTKWYDATCRWALCEDNYFDFDSLYMWDLGPQLINAQERDVHITAH